MIQQSPGCRRLVGASCHQQPSRYHQTCKSNNNAGIMLAQRLTRWPHIKPTSGSEVILPECPYHHGT